LSQSPHGRIVWNWSKLVQDPITCILALLLLLSLSLSLLLSPSPSLSLSLLIALLLLLSHVLKLVQQEVRIGKGQRRKKRRRSRRWRNYSQGTGHKSRIICLLCLTRSLWSFTDSRLLVLRSRWSYTLFSKSPVPAIVVVFWTKALLRVLWGGSRLAGFWLDPH